MVTGVNNLLARFNAFVWDDDMRELRGAHRYLVFILRVIHLLIKELMGGQLNLRAMSLVYTTLLSIVPLLAVSFSVLKVSIWLPAAIIGIVAAILTAVGTRVGCIVGSSSRIGNRAEIFGGLVLLGIGGNILYQHGVFGG